MGRVAFVIFVCRVSLDQLHEYPHGFLKTTLNLYRALHPLPNRNLPPILALSRFVAAVLSSVRVTRQSKIDGSPLAVVAILLQE